MPESAWLPSSTSTDGPAVSADVARPAGRVLILGATGEVGRRLLAELLADVRWSECEIHCIARRPLPALEAQARITVYVEAMASGSSLHAATLPLAKGVQVAFSCVAFSRTSTRNSAGLRRGGGFEMIEFLEVELPCAFARACLDAGVRHLGTFTGQGANPSMPVLCKWPYGPKILQCMGVRERELASMGFESVGIVRPAGVLGNDNLHTDKTNLRLESLGVMRGKSAPIHCAGIARAMTLMVIDALANRGPQVRLLEGGALFRTCGEQLRYHDRHVSSTH